METVAGGTPQRVPDVAAWAEDALAMLTGLPAVRRVGLALVEGGGRRLRFTASDRNGDPELSWCDVDAYDDVPLNTAIRTGEPVVGALDDLGSQYAAFVQNQRSTTTVALAAVPIVGTAQPLGGYVLFFDRPQRFDPRQRAELARVGHELGTALQRTRHSKERRPRVTRNAHADQPGALVATHEVENDPAAVGQARRFLRQTLQNWGVDGDSAETATLCLSELVTNAVIHAHDGCHVEVTLRDGTLTTTVRDSGTTTVAPPTSREEALQVHGRGLQLVDALATRWGYDVDSDGASVWFELKVG